MNNPEKLSENKFFEQYGRVCMERDLLREQVIELQQRLNNLTEMNQANKEGVSDGRKSGGKQV